MTVPIWLNYARVEGQPDSDRHPALRTMSVQDDGRYLVELCTGRIKVHVSAG